MTSSTDGIPGRPTFDGPAALDGLRSRWPELCRDLDAGALEPLASDSDQNFAFESSAGRFVLKIANANEDDALLRLQVRVLRELETARERGPGPGLETPVPVASSGRDLVEIDDREGRPWRAHVLSWLDGRLLSQVRPVDDAVLTGLGGGLARLDLALGTVAATLEEREPGLLAAAERDYDWDLARAENVFERHLAAVDEARRSIVERCAERFASVVAPAVGGLPRELIHNDANDNNVLVAVAPGRSPK